LADPPLRPDVFDGWSLNQKIINFRFDYQIDYHNIINSLEIM